MREDGDVEVQQETRRHPLQTHVGHQLGGMDREELIDGLDLDDETILDQKIKEAW